MEEYGSQAKYMPRDALFFSEQSAANDAGYVGTLVWQAIAASTLQDDVAFTYTQPGGAATLAQYAYMQAKV